MVDILNLRSPSSPGATGSAGLADSIIAGLKASERRFPGNNEEDQQYAYEKHIPTMVLYDDKGLDIYDSITNLKEYYLFDSELAILKKFGNEIARKLFSSTTRKVAEELPALGGGNDSSSGSSSSEDAPSLEEENESHHDSSYDKGAPGAKERWGDSRVGRNNYGVNGNLGLDDESSHPSIGSVIELGAGSLKKTSVLLRALSGLLQDDTMQHLNYYALDLEHRQLVSTLEQLEKTDGDSISTTSSSSSDDKKMSAKGICAAYDDAWSYLKNGRFDNDGQVHNEKKAILFLGSSIGNYSRTEAVDFLKELSSSAMSAGDSLLIGIDATDDTQIIESAYNDSHGVTRSFILNGVDHVDHILGNVGLKQEDFDYVSRYNQAEGRHEAYLKVKSDKSFTYSGTPISLKSGELIRIERSYKYTVHEALQLFDSAGLRVVQKWSDPDSDNAYYLYLVEKPLFSFPSTVSAIERGENPFGIPSLAEWDSLWKAWDCVTLSMIPSDLLHTKPIDLRHICLFYLGHIPGFLDIHLSRYLKEPFTEPRHYPDMFERGIDPNMDDPSKVHAHSVVPEKMEDWPSVDEIVTYRDRVRTRLQGVYKQRLTGENIDRRLARVMGMVYEHEALHLETLLYMCAQIAPGKLQAAPSFNAPDWKALAKTWDRQVAKEDRSSRDLVVKYNESTISVGHDDFDFQDKDSAFDPSHTFGWDNETPKRQVTVEAYKISQLPISNSEYFEFFKKSGCSKDLLPGSWYTMESGDIGVRVLAAPGYVNMEVAKHWPCMASGKQLEAYAKSVGGRLPTEMELRKYNIDNPVDHTEANIGFKNWHPIPASLPITLRNGSSTGSSNGGCWEWTCSDFAAYEGWQASELYPDYSRDFFDGCHWTMLGGSFATIPRIAGRKTFTNWYQANYPYVFAGARVAFDV